jgi:4-carboxymuconolactone decarboxylase
MSDQTRKQTLELGRRVLGELMGEAALKGRDAKKNSFNTTVQEYSDEVCFGMVWSRPGLARKHRSMLNIAMLTALGRLNQLKSHLEIGLNNGLTVEEIREILLQAAVYSGLPSAVDAFRVAEEVLKARGLLES